jgi:ABC-type polysaccharide/polyol phosphate export permease
LLPLLHPVRLMRAAFRGDGSWVLAWDVLYVLGLSGILLVVAARVTRRRLSS